jgi:hypothetical protein
MITGFRPLGSTSQELNRIQTNIQTVTDNIIRSDILDGRLIQNVAIGTTATNVAHGLNRRYKGWIVVDNNTACTLRSATSSLPNQFLSLIASSACTISLWVF